MRNRMSALRAIVAAALVYSLPACVESLVTFNLTQSHIDLILGMHNDARASVDEPPPSVAMPPYTWSDESRMLAEAIALQRANVSCSYPASPEVPTEKNHRDSNGTLCNESEAIVNSSAINDTVLWRHVMMEWLNEKEAYRYACRVNYYLVVHYLQMIWAESTSVGCGAVRCDEDDAMYTHMLCVYCPAGNTISDIFDFPMVVTLPYHTLDNDTSCNVTVTSTEVTTAPPPTTSMTTSAAASSTLSTTRSTVKPTVPTTRTAQTTRRQLSTTTTTTTPKADAASAPSKPADTATKAPPKTTAKATGTTSLTPLTAAPTDGASTKRDDQASKPASTKASSKRTMPVTATQPLPGFTIANTTLSAAPRSRVQLWWLLAALIFPFRVLR